MASNRVVAGLLAGVVMLSLIAGPAAGSPAADRTVQRDRASSMAAAAQELDDRLPAGSFTTAPGQSGHASVTDILTGARNRRDLGRWLGAIADAIKATSGADVAVAAPRSTSDHDDDEDEDAEPVAYGGSWAETYPAGDLNGDGHGDVVTYHIDLDTWTVSLEAASGDTGAVLWERAEGADGGLAWPLREDLTGDGAHDLLVFSLEILSDTFDDCWESDDEDCWDEPWEATFRWTVGLISGPDGATAWLRDFDGWIRESYSEPGSSDPVAVGVDEEFTYEIAGENLDIVPFVADLDGDGTSEVILNAIDFADRFTASETFVRSPAGSAGRWEGGWSLVAATRVSVIDETGTDVRHLEDTGAGRIALLWPMTHPDGAADAVWERSLYPDTNHECVYTTILLYLAHCPTDEYGDPSFEIAVLDGRTFEQRWARTVEGYGGAWSMGGDLDADGRNDLATWSYDAETWEGRAEPLSGATGEALWGDDVVVRDVMATGRLNAAPGDDVIAIDYDESYQESTDTYTITVHFQRRDGATGALLGQTSHSAQDRPADGGWDVEYLYATVGADGSGDGAMDLTVGKIVLEIREMDSGSDDEYWFTIRWGDASAVAESGATGEQLHTFANDGFGMLLMAEDFDGDGLSEVVEAAYSYGDEDATASFAPVRLTDTSPLWTDMASGAYVFHTWGDGGVYRHVDSLDQSHRFSTLVTALDAATGTPRWTLTSRP